MFRDGPRSFLFEPEQIIHWFRQNVHTSAFQNKQYPIYQVITLQQKQRLHPVVKLTAESVRKRPRMNLGPFCITDVLQPTGSTLGAA